MIKNVTAAHLLQLNAEMQQLSQMQNAHWYFNQSKIQAFHNFNGVRVQSLHEQHKAIVEKYFELDEKGVIKTETVPQLADKDGKIPPPQNRPVMKPDMKIEDYKKEADDFFSREVPLH